MRRKLSAIVFAFVQKVAGRLAVIHRLPGPVPYGAEHAGAVAEAHPDFGMLPGRLIVDQGNDLVAPFAAAKEDHLHLVVAKSIGSGPPPGFHRCWHIPRFRVKQVIRRLPPQPHGLDGPENGIIIFVGGDPRAGRRNADHISLFSVRRKTFESPQFSFFLDLIISGFDRKSNVPGLYLRVLKCYNDSGDGICSIPWKSTAFL